MGAMTRAPPSRRPPRGGGGGRTGALPHPEGGAGRGGLPGGGEGGAGPKGHAVEASGRAARGGENEDGTGGTPSSDGGAGGGGGAGRLQRGGEHVAGIGVELSGGARDEAPGIQLHTQEYPAPPLVELGDGNERGGPFSGLLVLCIDFNSSKLTEEVLKAYKEKIETLGGTYGTGFDYSQATHIAVMGDIPPGARSFWEGESKQVTKINWIDECFKEKKLLPIEAKESCEHLISQPNEMTPVSSKTSTRKCMSTTSKKLKHTTARNKSPSARKLDFSGFHRHMSCDRETELTEQLHDYSLRYRMSEHCELPGCDQILCCEDEEVEIIIPKSVKISKLSTKVIAVRSFKRIASMHEDGVALEGNYSAKSFVIYADDTVKLQGVADAIVVYSDEAADRDYTRFVHMMKDEVFFGQNLPFDLTEWLRIISQGVGACNRRLLCNHIDMMEPYQGYGHFVCMYQLFWNVKGNPGWTELLGSLGHYSGWKSQDVKCSFIQSTLDFVLEKNSTLGFDGDGRKVEYEDDIRGLLRVLKNTFKHRAKGHQRYAVYIIMNEFRQLLSDLQRALHEGGYLSHLSVNYSW